MAREWLTPIAYLARSGLAQCVYSTDSDLLVHLLDCPHPVMWFRSFNRKLNSCQTNITEATNDEHFSKFEEYQSRLINHWRLEDKAKMRNKIRFDTTQTLKNITYNTKHRTTRRASNKKFKRKTN